jgi:hypothetical protein
MVMYAHVGNRLANLVVSLLNSTHTGSRAVSYALVTSESPLSPPIFKDGLLLSHRLLH